jgi:hypothetical protein
MRRIRPPTLLCPNQIANVVQNLGRFGNKTAISRPFPRHDIGFVAGGKLSYEKGVNSDTDLSRLWAHWYISGSECWRGDRQVRGKLT